MNDYQMGILSCDCKLPCEQTVFDYALTQAKWPNSVYGSTYMSDASQNHPEISSSLNEQNILKVQVYFRELNYDVIVETPSYSILDLLSDIGGIFSFYLGLSVVALFEFLELWFDLFRIIVTKCYRLSSNSRTSTPITEISNMNLQNKGQSLVNLQNKNQGEG